MIFSLQTTTGTVVYLPLLVLFFSVSAISAQEPVIELGAGVSIQASSPVGTLSSINGSVPCADEFNGEYTFKPGGSIWSDILFSTSSNSQQFGDIRGLRLQIDFLNLTSEFSTDPSAQFPAYDDVLQRNVVVETRHTAAFTLQYLGGSVLTDIHIDSQLRLLAGIRVAIPLQGESLEEEAIVAPANATFLDRRQLQRIPEGSGVLDDLGMRLSIPFSVVYRPSISSTFFIEPSIGADVGLTNVQPDWTLLTVHAGIGFGVTLYRPSPPPPPPVAAEPSPVTTLPPPPPPLTGTVAVELAAPSGTPPLFRREIIARYVPLLPVVFFDSATSTLPERYNIARLGDSRAFVEESIEHDAEKAHNDVINVIASRMIRNPHTRVRIIGSSSGDESQREQLARQRAMEVRQLLTGVWGIDSERINVVARTSPAIPSNEEHPDGRAENRRVDLEFNDNALYAPTELRTVQPVIEPRSLTFLTTVLLNRNVENWVFTVYDSDGMVSTRKGMGHIPDTLVWELTTDDREHILEGRQSYYQLSVQDSLGNRLMSSEQLLKVSLDTSISVRGSSEVPLNVAEYLLITFDFNSAELTERGKADVKAISARIGPDSEVLVIGYTDRLGVEEHNRKLAEARARSVANHLPHGKSITVQGAESTQAPYSNDIQEGRFLNRTVRVIVRNPL